MSTSDPPYRFEDAQGYSVIVVQPRLNDSQWSEFENVGNELLGRLNQTKSPACLIDLSGLSYMGSAMVALIVRLWKAVKERNGKMVVINRHPMVFEVLKLAGLHNVWTIVESRDQGLKQLGKKSGESGDGSNALIGLGILGVVAGLVGLGLLLKLLPFGVDNAKISMACTLGGAAIGLFAGTICAAKGSGSKQKVGIAFAVISAVILIVGIINMPSGQATSALTPKQAAASGGAAETPLPTSVPSVRSKRKKDDDAPAPAKDAAAETQAPAGDAAAPETTPAAEPAKEEKATSETPAGDAKDDPAKTAEPKAAGDSKGLGGVKGLLNKKN